MKNELLYQSNNDQIYLFQKLGYTIKKFQQLNCSDPNLFTTTVLDNVISQKAPTSEPPQKSQKKKKKSKGNKKKKLSNNDMNLDPNSLQTTANASFHNVVSINDKSESEITKFSKDPKLRRKKQKNRNKDKDNSTKQDVDSLNVST